MPTFSIPFQGETLIIDVGAPTGTYTQGNSNMSCSCTETGLPACPTAGGNGIGVFTAGAAQIPVVALVPLQPFTVVVQRNGGIIAADPTVLADRDTIFGIVINGPAAGQIGIVVPWGTVVNPILGTGGWNFVLNGPVYVTAAGTLSQTPPTTGWTTPVGSALGQQAIMFVPPRAAVSAPPPPPVVAPVTYSGSITIASNVADAFNLVLTGNPTITFTGGVDGREFTVRAIQDNAGSHTITWGAGVNIGSLTVMPDTSPGNSANYTFAYNAYTAHYEMVRFVNFSND